MGAPDFHNSLASCPLKLPGRSSSTGIHPPGILAPVMPLRPCCADEARQNLKRHRDVAICDECGRLLLAYMGEADLEKTLAELAAAGTAHERGRLEDRGLTVIAKARADAPSDDDGPPPSGPRRAPRRGSAGRGRGGRRGGASGRSPPGGGGGSRRRGAPRRRGG